jgi:hypothetical protein
MPCPPFAGGKVFVRHNNSVDSQGLFNLNNS